MPFHTVSPARAPQYAHNDRPRRHSAAVLDTVWDLAIPRPAHKDVAPTTVRLVLLGLARHCNPERDGGALIAWPSIETLAALTELSARQVQRALAHLEQVGLLEVVLPGRRGGRGRPGCATRWRLCLDRGAQRQLGRGGLHVVPPHGGDTVSPPSTSAPMVATGAADGGDARDGKGAMVATVASPQHVTTLRTRNQSEPGREPLRASAREGESPAVSSLWPPTNPAPVAVVAPPPVPAEDAQALWADTLAILRSSTSAAHYDVYLAGTVGVSLNEDHGELVVRPVRPVHVAWLEGRFAAAISRALAAAAGRPLDVVLA